jgi:DNA-binding winged helix-turn-helix (wHTH) protein/Tol biopolymer transport system component
MLQPSRASRVIRFGLFEADLTARELRREGMKVKLQDRPFEVLTILLERPNELVTREEFRKRLWTADTFVDFDHSLNTSINRLRQALLDDAGNPRFVATVGRHGYRFIAPATPAGNENSHEEIPDVQLGPSVRADIPAPALTPTAPLIPDTEVATRPRGFSFKAWRAVMLLGVVIILPAGVLTASRFMPHSQARLLGITQISHTRNLDPWGRVTTDGVRLFFLQRAGDHWDLVQVPATGGDAQPFSAAFRNMRIVSVSPDRSEFLASTFTARLPDLPLWIVPVVGGPPRRIGNVIADDAVFTPDGQSITFDGPDGIYLCQRNGGDVRKLVSLPGRSANPTWSNDGRRLRFTLFDDVMGGSTIWEVSATGRDLHPVLSHWPLAGNERSGRWSPDARYFYFESRQNGVETVWVVRDEDSSWLAAAPKPVQLTFPPHEYGMPLPDENGRSIFVWGGQEHRELMKYDAASRTFESWLPNARAGWFAFSPNSQEFAFSRDGSLWRSDGDASEPRPLAAGFSAVGAIVWSPDGKRILFHAIPKGESLERFFIIPAEGGAPNQIRIGNELSEPVWTADGGSVIFAKRFASGVTPVDRSGLYRMELPSGAPSKIPGSENLIHPSPSLDGHYLAAISEHRSGQLAHLKLFDFKTQAWTEIASGALISGDAWTSDSKFIYYQDLLAPGQPVLRYSVNTHKSERVLDFSAVLHSGANRCGFAGLTSDGSIMAVVTRGEGDLYRLDLDLP